MALTDASMKTHIKDELGKLGFILDNDDLDAYCLAFAKGIVAAIKADAEILVAPAAFTSTPAVPGSPVTAPIAPTILKIT